MSKVKTVDYDSDYGYVTIISTNKRRCKHYYKQVTIFLDPECTGCEGFFLDGEEHDWYYENFFPDIDWSGLPEKGIFDDEDRAKIYIETKIGKLTF